MEFMLMRLINPGNLEAFQYVPGPLKPDGREIDVEDRCGVFRYMSQ
jgi:hypothetical protein